MDSTHQDYARSGKEIVYHIDSKTTERQVCQCFLDALRTEIGPLAKHKHGDGHHYYIQRTVGEEEFEHLRFLSKSSVLKPDTMIIVEASLDTDFSYLDELGFSVIKFKKYKTNMHVFIQQKRV